MEGRKAFCPNCGAAIAWRLGAAAALVCGHCRHAVVRTDRGIESYGKIADLVPTAPPLTVGDRGAIAQQPFEVVGRTQLDHGSGPWDELLVAFADGEWGWVARAQGKWYLTFLAEHAQAPPYETLKVGGVVPLAGDPRRWTVQEIGSSRLVSAEGELPFATPPGRRGRYADIVAPEGGFGTIDYGDGSGPPVVFLGREQPHEALQITHAMGPRPIEEVKVQDLTCPDCGAPCPIHVPDRTERVVCPYCFAALDYSRGLLAGVGKHRKPPFEVQIPLGTVGRLFGLEVMCIGVMQRYVRVDGRTYAWREYLLHSKETGYRWLMEDSGNWLYLEPISAADVTETGRRAIYQGKKHRLYNVARPVVEHVIGEFYWKVQVGDTSQACDYIAPPTMLSKETTDREVVWSRGLHVEPRTITKAFDLPRDLPKSWDVSPCKPNPAAPLVPAIVALVLTIGAGIFEAKTSYDIPYRTFTNQVLTLPTAQEDALKGDETTRLRAMEPVGDTSKVTYTPAFELVPPNRRLQLYLDMDQADTWVGAACALIDEETGRRREFLLEQDNYLGKHRSRRTGVTFDDVEPEHAHRVRVDLRWVAKTPETPKPVPILKVWSPSMSTTSFGLYFTLFFVWLPVGLIAIRWQLFESRRWSNASLP